MINKFLKLVKFVEEYWVMRAVVIVFGWLFYLGVKDWQYPEVQTKREIIIIW